MSPTAARLTGVDLDLEGRDAWLWRFSRTGHRDSEPGEGDVDGDIPGEGHVGLELLLEDPLRLLGRRRADHLLGLDHVDVWIEPSAHSLDDGDVPQRHAHEQELATVGESPVGGHLDEIVHRARRAGADRVVGQVLGYADQSQPRQDEDR